MKARLIGIAAALCAAGCGFRDGPVAGGTTTETEASIMGVVRNPDGSAAVGARVHIRPSDYLPLRLADSAVAGDLVTDSLGRFSYTTKDTGHFHLEAARGDSLGLLIRNLSPGKESRNLIGTLEATGSLRMNILVPKAGMACVARTFGLERYQAADSAGAMRLTLPAGDYRMVITGDATVLPLVLDSVRIDGGKETLLDSLRFPDLDSALLGHWPFDEGTGETVADVSGNGHAAAMIGAKWVTGKSGGALEFAKGQGYVDAGAPTPDPFALTKTDDYTFAAWAKVGNPVPNRGVARRIISKQGNGAYSTFLRVFPDGRPGFASNLKDPAKRSAAAIGVRDLLAPVNVADGAWHHLAGICRKGRLELYVDGKLRASILNDSLATVNTFTDYNDKSGVLYPDPGLDGHLTFGCVTSGQDGFDGAIDEVRIYSRALGAHEVLQLARPFPRP